MSISLIDKKSSTLKQIPINSEFLNTTILKKIVCNSLTCQLSELRLFHYDTDQEFKENQIIKRGDKIHYVISSQGQNPNSPDNKKKGIIYPNELQKIIENSKIIVIKSSNEENIQKSKDHSLWATTFSNQERLRYFFNNSQNVILLFATNRSFEIKGIARMESQPDRLTDKSVWSGVSNIRLGGNFKIKWLRKKPLSLVLVQKALGTNFKETIIKACDGQQFDPNSCKKLASLFEIPEEPYYVVQNKIQSSTKKEDQKIKSQSLIPHPMGFLPFPFNQSLLEIKPPNAQRNEKQKQQKNDSSKSRSSSSQSSRKNKKIKKKSHKKSKKSKKQKKSHKKYSQSSDDSQSFQNSDYSQNSEVSRKKSKSKKDKKRKKEKKSKKHRS